MSVSATEVAKAAVEFWRQGLGEDETEKRLKASIQYAKISAMEFDEAAELITAATNTMEVSAQHVADIFAYLGDASASGADEIGIAMQKASASAVEFGLSFEWLGAYIATISEKTRQAPEVIGTSLNSIMARLHSIKAKKKLEDLRNAYKQVSGDIKAYDYTPTTSAKGSGSSSSGGSGGKKSGGSSAKVTKYKATYPAIGKAKGGTLSGYSSPEEAEKAARSKINSICRELSGSSSSMIGEWARTFYSKIKVTAYAKGGLNQATGLAWLDGTKARPERVLSPYQTELFEDLLKTLHAIRTVQAPQAVVRPQLPETVQNQPLTIESITVNVERLEKEADYDAMAERVGEKIMERAMRGMTVGGLRLG